VHCPILRVTPISTEVHDSSISFIGLGRLRAWWWGIAVVYFTSCLWLAARTRVFMDQIWITENGRQLLEPDTDYSVYMYPDGSSDLPVSWIGPLIAEAAFRLTGGMLGFRVIGILAMLALGWCALRLARRYGVPSLPSLLVVVAFLFDGNLLQSVILGRADALALAAIVAGLMLATQGADKLREGRGGLGLVAVGYGLCAVSPGIWTSAVLIGPLVIVHWIVNVRATASIRNRGWSWWVAFVLTPGVLVTVFLLIPYALVFSHGSAKFSGYLLAQNLEIGYGNRMLQILSPSIVLSPSVVLVIAGLLSLSSLNNRFIGAAMALGVIACFVSGFYPFRTPYLLLYLAAACLLFAAQIHSSAHRGALTRLFGLAAITAVGLMVLRILLGIGNEPPPTQSSAWLQALPKDTKIGDFSWDFYESAREARLRPMRAFPRMRPVAVEQWIVSAQPDYVIRAIIPTQTWVMVDDLDQSLTKSGYCHSANINWQGQRVDNGVPTRAIPTPMLWRLGMFRSHGPYALWSLCQNM